jgi:hypothetical protein
MPFADACDGRCFQIVTDSHEHEIKRMPPAIPPAWDFQDLFCTVFGSAQRPLAARTGYVYGVQSRKVGREAVWQSK